MCLVFGLSAGEVGILATDTRWRVETTDGETHRFEAGEKLGHLGTGWLSATGGGMTARMVLQAVRDAGDLGHVQRTLAELAAENADIVRIAFSGDDEERTRFLVLRPAVKGAQVHHLAADGTHMDGGPGKLLISWPPEIDDDLSAALLAEARAKMRTAGSLAGLVQIVAGLFAFCAARADSMSGVVEFGILLNGGAGVRHLRLHGDAATVVAMSTADVARALEHATQRPAGQGFRAHDAAAAASLEHLYRTTAERFNLTTTGA